jgi:hypothetical protein
MSVLTVGGSDDSGAIGVLLRGDRTEVAFNTISGSDAFSYDYGRDGAAVEVYGGQKNHIHHNFAQDNDAFSELGHSRSADNTYAYNVVLSSLETSVFVVTRGSGSSYGPVLRTSLYNNSVLLTGAQSQGVVCSSGCNADILRMRNNVIQAVWKVGYADAPLTRTTTFITGDVSSSQWAVIAELLIPGSSMGAAATSISAHRAQPSTVVSPSDIRATSRGPRFLLMGTVMGAPSRSRRVRVLSGVAVALHGVDGGPVLGIEVDLGRSSSAAAAASKTSVSIRKNWHASLPFRKRHGRMMRLTAIVGAGS